jgi:tripartite-type tricarboxylate transporter receptor subunit TctC
MTPSRRDVLHLVGTAAVLNSGLHAAHALDYPTKPIRLIVGFPPGGPNDILGRMIAQWLTGRLGQQFEVVNQPGNANNLATATVVRAPADGYTLLLVGPANAISASLRRDLDFDFLRDIAPVGGLTREALVMVVHPAIPAHTVAEFIVLTRAEPARFKIASAGTGSAPHLSGELFKRLTALDLPVVQYAGGGPALKAMIAGEADVMFEPTSAAIEPVRAGKLRALAVTTTTRSTALPDAPPLAEAVPGYEASAATGLGAPRETPADIIERLNREINAAFADPMMMARLAETGGSPLPGSPADFGRLMAAETEKWARVIRFSGVGSP